MNFHFVLGGRDLEMLEIASLLASEAVAFSDKGLSWGAGLSHYHQELAALPLSVIPVAVELLDDLPDELSGQAAWRSRLISIDHHGDRTGEPASLRQVFKLLGLSEAQWTRHMDLVVANDVAHIAGLESAGASPAEMQAIRAADRQAQGLTPAHEADGLTALETAVVWHQTTVVHLAHGHMAAVADPLALDPRFARLPRNLLVRSPGEIGYFGSAALVETLNRAMPGGWRGGNPPKSAFWGIAGREPRISIIWDKSLAILAENAPLWPFSTDI